MLTHKIYVLRLARRLHVVSGMLSACLALIVLKSLWLPTLFLREPSTSTNIQIYAYQLRDITEGNTIRLYPLTPYIDSSVA